jgi:hypothetical protein
MEVGIAYINDIIGDFTFEFGFYSLVDLLLINLFTVTVLNLFIISYDDM